MAKRHYSNGHEGHMGMMETAHKAMERDSMLHDDPRAIANMPQEVMMKPWPSADSYMPEGLDDTISGVNKQIVTLDGAKRDKHLMPKKV